MYSHHKSTLSAGKSIFNFNLVNDDIPTAVKTNYQEYSPYGGDFGSSNLKSPSKYHSKIQDAKNLISSVIS